MIATVCCLNAALTAFLSADGKTKVNMFFRANDQIQLTKLKIKVLHATLLLLLVYEGAYVTAVATVLIDKVV